MKASLQQETQISSRLKVLALSSALLVSIGACGSNNSTNPNIDPKLAKAVINNYANIAEANYADSVETAEALHLGIDDFLAAPNETSYLQAKTLWKQSRIYYGQSEIFRFYDGPIDNGTDGPEGRINSWPLDEATIDYTFDKNSQIILNTGIINDTNITIDADTIAGLNTDGGEDSITTGYHAIEFLLWGQDYNENPQASGQRPYTDYVIGNGGTESNRDRRGEYLEVVAHLLVEDLEQVANAWKSDGDNYRKNDFVSINTDEAIRRMIVGVGSMAGGELSSERMKTALETKQQEEEHSCFSDNTDVDIAMNFKGIKNIYFGTYTSLHGTVIQGPGLHDLFAAGAPEFDTQMQAKLNSAEVAINKIGDYVEQGFPFDQQIQGIGSLINGEYESRTNIKNAVVALQEFGTLIGQAAAEIGIDINKIAE